MIKTFSFRIKDSTCAKHLEAMARATNSVWNFCNETQRAAIKWGKKWPTGFDLNNLTAGSSRELGLHSQTVQAIGEEYARIKNRRKDFLHKLSTRLVEENELIVIGNVSAFRLAKTRMAKSVLDAGWSMFRTLLSYKAIARKVVFAEINEAYTTRTCSQCGARGGPQGREGLGVREWVCSACGAVHDRDVNAALNILRLGHQSLRSEVA